MLTELLMTLLYLPFLLDNDDDGAGGGGGDDDHQDDDDGAGDDDKGGKGGAGETETVEELKARLAESNRRQNALQQQINQMGQTIPPHLRERAKTDRDAVLMELGIDPTGIVSDFLGKDALKDDPGARALRKLEAMERRLEQEAEARRQIEAQAQAQAQANAEREMQARYAKFLEKNGSKFEALAAEDDAPLLMLKRMIQIYNTDGYAASEKRIADELEQELTEKHKQRATKLSKSKKLGGLYRPARGRGRTLSDDGAGGGPPKKADRSKMSPKEQFLYDIAQAKRAAALEERRGRAPTSYVAGDIDDADLEAFEGEE